MSSGDQYLAVLMLTGAIALAPLPGQPQGFGDYTAPPAERPPPRPSPSPKPKASSKPRPEASKGNAIRPAMVRIRGGCFRMGSPRSDPERKEDESQHQVCVNSFEMGKYEVTQGQWKAVMGSNRSFHTGCANCPVDSVSWTDVQDFIARLNLHTGDRYRLPTEAEWEYACRGHGMEQRYCGGYDLDRLAWYNLKSGRIRTQPVGRKAPNSLGLFDMSGNVNEWTCSYYDEDYGGAETRCADKDRSGARVYRGGSWFEAGRAARSTARGGLPPFATIKAVLGFRLARN